VNYDLAFFVALGFEALGKARRDPAPPVLTRYATWLMGRRVSYSTVKAREKLGWWPKSDYRTSLERAVRWFDDQSKDGAPS
jgi:nucleoside-diphosphate-sugar epimerase